MPLRTTLLALVAAIPGSPVVARERHDDGAWAATMTVACRKVAR